MNFCTQVFELCIAVYVMHLSIGILLDVFFIRASLIQDSLRMLSLLAAEVGEG